MLKSGEGASCLVVVTKATVFASQTKSNYPIYQGEGSERGRLVKEGKGVRTGERATRTNALKFPFPFWLFFSSFLSIFRGRHLKASDKLTIGTAIAPEPGQPFFFFFLGRNILFSIPRSFFAPFLLLLLYILICCQLLSARLHGVGTSRVICSNTVFPFTTNKREY